jgi:hypothetical protein
VFVWLSKALPLMWLLFLFSFLFSFASVVFIGCGGVFLVLVVFPALLTMVVVMVVLSAAVYLVVLLGFSRALGGGCIFGALGNGGCGGGFGGGRVFGGVDRFLVCSW